MKSINYYTHTITLPTTLKQTLLLLENTHIHTHTHMYIYIYMYIHTHTYKHIFLFCSFKNKHNKLIAMEVKTAGP